MVPRLLPRGGVRQGHGSDRLRPQSGQRPGQADRPPLRGGSSGYPLPADDLWRHLPVRRGVRHLSHGLFHLPGRRPAPHPAARRHCHRRLRHHHDRRARHPPDSEPDPHRLLWHHHHGGSAPVPCGLRRYAAARLYLPGVAGAPVPPQGPALCPRPQAQGSGSRLQGSALLALGHRHRPPGGGCAHAQPVPLAAQSLCRH